MSSQKDIEIIAKIVDRAATMNIGLGDRISQMMDIDHAHAQHPLRLDDFLSADDFNFAHDFCGIQRHMNRTTGQLDNCFVPRFARRT